MRNLKFWNGRITGAGNGGHSGYIAAYTKKDAVEIGKRAFGRNFSRYELDTYWAPCWGNAMDNAQVELPGAWTVDYMGRVWKLEGESKQ